MFNKWYYGVPTALTNTHSLLGQLSNKFESFLIENYVFIYLAFGYIIRANICIF